MTDATRDAAPLVVGAPSGTGDGAELAYAQLAHVLGLTPECPELQLALTHRSFAFEQGGLPHNERLEFLGDSVLGVIITDELYHRHADLSEGDLARIRAAVVNMRALARIGRELNVGPCLRLGKGERVTDGRNKDSILADTVEALIGAVYLVRGMAAADGFVRSTFSPMVNEAVTTGLHTDWKTTLQELVARRNLPVPRYDVTSTGPDHAKQFSASVRVGHRCVGEGSGTSKKVAEQEAAELACRAVKKKKAAYFTEEPASPKAATGPSDG